MSDVKQLIDRASEAYEARGEWVELYDELYEYAIPNRKPIKSGVRGDGNTGTRSNNKRVFDATATKAAYRFAGRMSRDVTPPFQKFFELKVGPALKQELLNSVGPDNLKDAMQQLESELEMVTEQGQALLESANFSLSADEMYIDLFGGQGAMLILEDAKSIVKFGSVPAGQIALEEDGMGNVIGVYWRKEFRFADLKREWKTSKWSTDTEKAIAENKKGRVQILQATVYNYDTERWDHYVIEENKSHCGYKELNLLTSPWLTPRFWKVPEEAMGRGPGMAALPTIKTLNKVTELTLKAVAFAVLGLWTYRNDRVFNPKTSRMFPGAMWAVSSNGGPMGEALKRQEMPGRYDVSNIVLQDLREQVKQTTFDDTLPPDSGAVRSATEILERMKRLMSDLAGAYPRLLLEIVIPLVRRLIDVMYRRKLIKTKIPIDQLVVKVQITSPIARGQAASDVSNIVEWLQMMIALFGLEPTMLVAKVEEILPTIGQMMGISPKLMRSKAERDGLQKMIAELIASAQKPPAQPPPQQPLQKAA